MHPASGRTASYVLAAGLAALTVAAAGPAHAQRVGAGNGWVTLLAGGTAASGLQGVLVSDPAAGPEAEVYQGNLAPQATASLGAALTYWLTDGWGVRASGSYAPSRLELRLDEDARMALPEAGGEGGAPLELSELSLITAELGAIFLLPVPWTRFMPYASVGGGALRYGFPGVPVSGNTTRDVATVAVEPRWQPAAYIAAGVVIPLADEDLSLSFELADHLTPTPLPYEASEDAVRGHALLFSAAPDEAARGDAGADRVRLTSHFRVSAGFVFTLGGPRRGAPTPGPVGDAEPPELEP